VAESLLALLTRFALLNIHLTWDERWKRFCLCGLLQLRMFVHFFRVLD
jgi:hypothetical protein